MSRPCKFCLAAYPILFEDGDVTSCEWEHRDDPRVYALATEMARAMSGTGDDEHTGWFLADADGVVDQFPEPPARWRVSRLPSGKRDGEDGIECRLRINGTTFVALEGGKDSRGSILPLATFRQQEREASRG